MLTNNPETNQFIRTIDGNIFRPYDGEIGVWDMDTNGSKQIVLTDITSITQILSIAAFVTDDNNTYFWPLPFWNSLTETVDGGIGSVNIGTPAITFTRRDLGMFDAVEFDDSVMNRGFFTIWYR